MLEELPMPVKMVPKEVFDEALQDAARRLDDSPALRQVTVISQLIAWVYMLEIGVLHTSMQAQ